MFGGKTTAQTSILAKDLGNFFKELSAKQNDRIILIMSTFQKIVKISK